MDKKNVYLFGSSSKEIGYKIIDTLKSLGGKGDLFQCADRGEGFIYFIGTDKDIDGVIRSVPADSIEGRLIQSSWEEIKPEPIDPIIPVGKYELERLKEEVERVRLPQLEKIKEMEESLRTTKQDLIKFIDDHLSVSVFRDVESYIPYEDCISHEDGEYSYEEDRTIPLTIGNDKVFWADVESLMKDIIARDGVITYEALVEFYKEEDE